MLGGLNSDNFAFEKSLDMEIQEKLNEVKSSLPDNVLLVAVSKTHPAEMIMEAYNAGQRVFGENKVQEMVAKHDVLPNDIEWHLIGHLQTNKVKYIASFVKLVHSVDSIKLLQVIDKEAKNVNRVIDCLLQMHIAQEETKFGLSEDELIELLESTYYKQMQNVRVVGLMGMASLTDNMEQVRAEFHQLREIFTRTKKQFFAEVQCFKELSMGMSHDYSVAVNEGSTMVRVGSKIFGQRFYTNKD